MDEDLHIELSFSSMTPSDALVVYVRERLTAALRGAQTLAPIRVTLGMRGFDNVAEASCGDRGSPLTFRATSPADLYSAIDRVAEALAAGIAPR